MSQAPKKVHTTESRRLILREFKTADASGIFELDSNPKVHIFLGNKPITSIEKAAGVVAHIQNQYKKFGVGRLAVEEKSTGRYMGWAGLKFIDEDMGAGTNYHDLGYRFIEEFWGQGFATEAALATLDLAFSQMQLDRVCAMADVRHDVWNAILTKIGLKQIKTIDYDGQPHYFYEMKRVEWLVHPLNKANDLAQ